MITELNGDYCSGAARLHINGISTGFISSLGLNFVTELYRAIAQDDNSFGYVVIEGDEVLAFVAFSANLGKLYKYVLKRKFFSFAPKIAWRMLNIATFRKVLANLFYPAKMKKMDLPDAELLAIVVAEAGRGKGLAGKLVEAGFDQCRKRGIDRVKVLVAASNDPANKMYNKCGFKFIQQIDSHGVLSNIYVAELNPCD